MKPKTALQRQIVGLSRRLKPVTEKQVAWAYDHCFEHIAYRTAKDTLTCGDCGHTWKSETTMVDTFCGCACPHCRKELKVSDTRKRTFKQCYYFCIVTTCKGYQVVRIVMIKADSKKGRAAKYFYTEVAQRWITTEGKVITIAKLRGMGFTYSDLWIFGSDMEVRPHHAIYDIISDCDHYPRVRVLPIFKRNGFKGEFHNTVPFRLLQSLLTDSKTETLLKAGQHTLLPHFVHYPYRMGKYWNAVKICIRKGYAIEEVAMWCDYLDLLEHFHKDTQNPKYICPADLKAEHDRLMAVRNRQIERQRRERERERIIERQEAERRKLEQMRENERIYAEMKGKYLDLVFSDGVLRIQVLQNVQEFYEEGKAMRHCVFTNDYFKRENSLVLSARIGDERIETIEISLETFEIIQSYGVMNQCTRYHEQIIDLVNRNIRLVRQRMMNVA
jgi:hypothetical protein